MLLSTAASSALRSCVLGAEAGFPGLSQEKVCCLLPRDAPSAGSHPPALYPHRAAATPAAARGNPVQLDKENGVPFLGHCGVCSGLTGPRLMLSVLKLGASVNDKETPCWVLCFISDPAVEILPKELPVRDNGFKG